MTLKNSLESSLAIRIKALKKELKKRSISAYLFEDTHDIFYLSGQEFSRAMLFVTQSAAWLLVDGRYLQVAKEKTSFEVLNITEKKAFVAIKDILLQGIRSLGFDASKTSLGRYQELKKRFPNLAKKENPLVELRQVKDLYEQMCLQRSANILTEAVKSTQKYFKEGITEKEISNLFESKALDLGADRMSFRPIVAFGKNAAMPHYRSGQETLKKNTLILIDAGVMKDGYASDMTRCFFFGRAKKEDMQIFQACHKALKRVLKEIKAGVSIKRLDQLARDVVIDEGFSDIPHSLGHGVGLEVHETPRLSKKAQNKKLKENMVVTIEPGIYIPNQRGVRLEEMILVTKTGYKNFYKNYPI